MKPANVDHNERPISISAQTRPVDTKDDPDVSLSTASHGQGSKNNDLKIKFDHFRIPKYAKSTLFDEFRLHLLQIVRKSIAR